MKSKNTILILSLISFSCSFFVYSETIKVIAPQHENDASHGYFVHILKRALALTSTGATDTVLLESLPYPGQERAMKLLETGKYYDINWSANSIERNQKLIYVPFPLFKGLLGQRGFVITPSSLSNLKSISSISDVKKMNICQGRGWPDAKILANNGFNITEVTYFDAMLNMVKLGRCDAVTLSILEGPVEVASLSNKQSELIFFDQLIISYELVMNFYLPRDSVELQKRLYKGLLILERTGEFDQIMQTQALTRDFMHNLHNKNRQVFELPIQSHHVIEQRPFFLNIHQ